MQSIHPMISPHHMKNAFLMMLIAACSAFPVLVSADNETGPEQVVLENIKKRFPSTKIDAVSPTPVQGIYEVVMGRNIAFSDADGRFFIFGHMFDMEKQRDLTAERKQSLRKVDWSALPLENSIMFRQGKGERKLAVFSDPDCPFCKRLEEQLALLDNVTIHLFPFPLDSLHPRARSKSISIWCSENRQQAWREAVSTGRDFVEANCENPISSNIALAGKLGISGTPTLISMDGRVASGAMRAERISEWLNIR